LDRFVHQTTSDTDGHRRGGNTNGGGHFLIQVTQRYSC
jgi:hypothetical protein